MALKHAQLAALAALLSVPAAYGDDAAQPAAVLASTRTAAAVPRGPSLGDVYRVPDGARDPFVPVAVQAVGAVRSAKSPKIRDAKFSLQNAELVGIISLGQEKQAVLSDRETGASFFLMRGFIYDRKHQPVQGYSGVLEERQVTVYGPADVVKTLKLPERDTTGKRR